jgi:hypothetical protein
MIIQNVQSGWRKRSGWVISRDPYSEKQFYDTALQWLATGDCERKCNNREICNNVSIAGQADARTAAVSLPWTTVSKCLPCFPTWHYASSSDQPFRLESQQGTSSDTADLYDVPKAHLY